MEGRRCADIFPVRAIRLTQVPTSGGPLADLRRGFSSLAACLQSIVRLVASRRDRTLAISQDDVNRAGFRFPRALNGRTMLSDPLTCQLGRAGLTSLVETDNARDGD
jgi:hypothetical protein